MAAKNQRQTGEQIQNIEELSVGDEVITSKGDAMDKKPLVVKDIQEIDGTLQATIQGSWANAKKYSLVDSDKFGITMPDVGIITVERVSTAGPEKATEEYLNEQVKVCHKEGRIIGKSVNSYTASIELGDVNQHVVLDSGWVHERVDIEEGDH